MTGNAPQRPLEGFTIVEMGNFIAGPYAGMLLADLGAEVVKVEEVKSGDPFRAWGKGLYSPAFCAFNRGKKSLTLDVRHPRGKDALLRLTDRADALVENFRPGVMARLGADYETVAARNPRIVYCSLSGFGQSGPYRDRPSYDTVGQAMGGLLALLTDPDDPRPRGPALADSLTGLFGDDIANRPLGRIVDFVFIIALVGGTGTSLGLAAPMLAACVAKLFGIEQTPLLEYAVVLLAVALFAYSVFRGLTKGIKVLSDINMSVAGVFALFVLFTGPTLFALKHGTNSLGLMVQEFIRLNTWTDPVLKTNFVEDWSIFYWAWWLAYGPYIGIFVTRISRGRTLRELIFGMVGFGTVGCALFYITVGNTAMWMDLEGLVPARELVAAGEAEQAIASIMAAIPWQPLPLIAFIVVAFIFVTTTYDSASYAISASATRQLQAGQNPARWHRVFWAFALAVLPLALMFLGGLDAIKSSVLVVSLPLLVIGVAMIVSLFRTLRE